MKEGWLNDDYLILFDESEVEQAGKRYSVEGMLPSYRIVGFRSWDDFIVMDSAGRTFTIPTVPVDMRYLATYTLPSPETELKEDTRFKGKIKWYVQPIAFGGDPRSSENIVWINADDHAEVVLWWNSIYLSQKPA